MSRDKLIKRKPHNSSGFFFQTTPFKDFFYYYYFWETSTRCRRQLNLSTEAESKVSHDGNVVNMLKRHGQLSLQIPKKKKEKKTHT